MQRTVGFFIAPAESHIIATLGLARILTTEGYSVIYALPKEKSYIALVNGYKVFILKSLPFGCGFEKSITRIQNKEFADFIEIYYRFKNTLWKIRSKDIDEFITKNNPKILFFDAFNSTDLLIAISIIQNLETKLVTIHTTFPVYSSSTFPLLNSHFLPDQQGNIRFEKIRFNLKRFFGDLKDWVRYLSFDDRSLIKKKINQLSTANLFQGISYQRYNSLYPILKGKKEIILAPKEIDFFNSQGNLNAYYAGLMIDVDRRDISLNNDDLHILFKSIENSKKYHRKIVYCSFGSIYKYRPDKDFIRRIISAIKSIDSILLIISGVASKKFVMKDQENILFFDKVPQLKILIDTDIFITHGGLNSIKEAIYYKVPMLVYPLDPRWDNPGNAARVFYHQIGLRGDMMKDTSQDIKQKIIELLSNQSYKINLDKINREIYQSYKSIDLINFIKR